MLIDGGVNQVDHSNLRELFPNINRHFLSNPVFVKQLKLAVKSILLDEYNKTIDSSDDTRSIIYKAIQSLKYSSELSSSAIQTIRDIIASHSRIINSEDFSPDFTHSYAMTTNIAIADKVITIQTMQKSLQSGKSRPNQDFNQILALYYDNKNLAIVEETILPLPNSTISPSKTISKYDLNGNPIKSTDVQQTGNESR